MPATSVAQLLLWGIFTGAHVHFQSASYVNPPSLSSTCVTGDAECAHRQTCSHRICPGGVKIQTSVSLWTEITVKHSRHWLLFVASVTKETDVTVCLFFLRQTLIINFCNKNTIWNVTHWPGSRQADQVQGSMLILFQKIDKFVISQEKGSHKHSWYLWNQD